MRVRELEKQISNLEIRQQELILKLEKPETYEQGSAVMELNRELQAVSKDLEKMMIDWEQLHDPGASKPDGINAALEKFDS